MAKVSGMPGRERVVIIGAGFAGLSCAQTLGDAPFDVTVIDRHNYHLFQPLLYQVATAALSPADIAAPIRSILGGRRNTTVLLAEVSGIDLRRRVVVADDREVPFDRLIVATGAHHTYFGNDGWARHAPGLKRIDDATDLRRRILLAFERAETECCPELRAALLSFVVVGGGPTGVEMAGAIAELARKALAADFRTIDPRSARVVLVEGADRLLPSFHPHLSEKACRALVLLGVEVRLGSAVTACDAQGVVLADERIPAATIVWAAGVMASPAGRWLGAATDRAGRVQVGPDLSLPGHGDVFVIGDTAHVDGPDGRPLPGVAPVAKQQGRYVARLLKARAEGSDLPPFRYRDPGMMATIGRRRAVAELGRLRISGLAAWLLWCVAHVWFLIGFRNRLAVTMNWIWNYLTFQRGARLITGRSGSRTEVLESPPAMAAGALGAHVVPTRAQAVVE
jgi:NADH dehydrogenase